MAHCQVLGEKMQAVRLEAVSKMYGETVAVKDLSLEVAPGEFLFLLGPSGSGKTTVLRMIGGYEQPTTGSIEIGGHDVTQLPVHQRNIGMVFQSYALFPHMTVAQNVAFGLKMRHVAKGEIKQRVAEALELVELDGLGQRYPNQLSGGQQQRVALARAIVYRPALLLLDEPLANLDRRLRDTMRVELKQLQRRLGLTTIMVTHDQEESLSMADRVALLYQGSLEQSGSSVEIYNQPASPFVAAFIGEMNVFRGQISQLAGVEYVVQADNFKFRVAAEQTARVGDDITVCLRAERLVLGQAALEGGMGWNIFKATIEFVSYLGASTLYLLRLESGAALKALQTNLVGQTLYSPGQSLTVGWPIASAICFLND